MMKEYLYDNFKVEVENFDRLTAEQSGISQTCGRASCWFTVAVEFPSDELRSTLKCVLL